MPRMRREGMRDIPMEIMRSVSKNRVAWWSPTGRAESVRGQGLRLSPLHQTLCSFVPSRPASRYRAREQILYRFELLSSAAWSDGTIATKLRRKGLMA